MEKLKAAGIVGTPHVISPEDEAAVNRLTEDEVNTLIALKVKLSGGSLHATSHGGPGPVGTVSF